MEPRDVEDCLYMEQKNECISNPTCGGDSVDNNMATGPQFVGGGDYCEMALLGHLEGKFRRVD